MHDITLSVIYGYLILGTVVLLIMNFMRDSETGSSRYFDNLKIPEKFIFGVIIIMVGFPVYVFFLLHDWPPSDDSV